MLAETVSKIRSRHRARQGALDGEQGFAMIVAVMVMAILFVLATAMLATGVHLDNATGRDRRWNQALQVAESGIDAALMAAGHDPDYAGGVVAVPGGEAHVTVTRPEIGWIVIESSGWIPNSTAPGALNRRIQVTYGPAASFKYALFSDVGLEVKNNVTVEGDVFANESIVLQQNSTVFGSVISATGTIDMANGAQIRQNDGEGGHAFSGGYHLTDGWAIRLAPNTNQTIIEGSAHAQAESCPGPSEDETRYKISNAGRIKGDAVARGSINGTVEGSITPFNCQPRHATQLLPEFHYDPDNYPGINEYDSVAEFETWLSTNTSAMNGHHRITASPDDVLAIANVTMTSSFTLITNTRLDFGNNVRYCGPADERVEIISLNSSVDPPAVDIKNNFQINTAPGCPDDSPSVLIYSHGAIHVKNNLESNGAVFAGAISITNNFEVAYDPRVERTVGFGPVRFERVGWEELRPVT